MSRDLKFIVALFAMLLLGVACERQKVIPDSELKEIFKEIYLTNAFLQSGTTLNTVVKDSLDIYRPILGKYGYRIDDLQHTMANFAKRKSVRLSDVIDRAITELENEESELRYQASVLDTISMRAQRMFEERIIEDSSLRATVISDTANLTIQIPVKPGTYEIAFDYHIDSTDQNRSLRNVFTLKNAYGKQSAAPVTNWMTSRRPQSYTAKIDTKPSDVTLEMRFGSYQSNMTKPALRIDSLYVTYYPPVEEALRRMSRDVYGYKLSIEGYDDSEMPPGSGPLRPDAPRTTQGRDSDD